MKALTVALMAVSMVCFGLAAISFPPTEPHQHRLVAAGLFTWSLAVMIERVNAL